MEDVEEDLLESMGLDANPMDSNDQLWYNLTGEGKYKKIENLRFWLRHEMYRYNHILEKNIKITKNIVKDGKPQDVSLSRIDYAKVAIEYYLQMYHLPWFEDRDGFEPADMLTMIDKIVAHGDMRQVIEKID